MYWAQSVIRVLTFHSILLIKVYVVWKYFFFYSMHSDLKNILHHHKYTVWNICALRSLQTWLNSSCQQLVSASIGSVYKLSTTCPGGGGPAACTHCPSSSGGGARKNTIQFNSLKGAHEVVSRQVDGYNKKIKQGLLIAMILFKKLVFFWQNSFAIVF